MGLQDILKSIEMNGEIPSVTWQRWVLITKDSGFTCIGSDYLLFPAELSQFVRDELKINIRDPNLIDVVCSVGFEKGEEDLTSLRIIYDIKPRPSWRFKP